MCIILILSSLIFAIVLAELKKYYTKLYHCLPQNYVKTVDKIKQLIPGVPADYVDHLRTFASNEINEVIIGDVMLVIRTDEDVLPFCDVMEELCNETVSKNVIKTLRNGKLKIIYYNVACTVLGMWQ